MASGPIRGHRLQRMRFPACDARTFPCRTAPPCAVADGDDPYARRFPCPIPRPSSWSMKQAIAAASCRWSAPLRDIVTAPAFLAAVALLGTAFVALFWQWLSRQNRYSSEYLQDWG